MGKWFSRLAGGEEKIILIETDLYTAAVSTKGGVIKKWELKEFTTWNGFPVQLVDMGKGGDFSVIFTSSDGKFINTKDLYFSADVQNWKKVVLKGTDEYRLDLVLRVQGDSSRVIKTLIFKNGLYSFDASLKFQNMENVISGFEYQVVWEHSTNITENNSQDEARFAAAYSFIGGELEQIDAGNFNEEYRSNLVGSTDWVASRSKYFAVALIPKGRKGEGSYLEGRDLHCHTMV